jgi:hypothetical protein
VSRSIDGVRCNNPHFKHVEKTSTLGKALCPVYDQYRKKDRVDTRLYTEFFQQCRKEQARFEFEKRPKGRPKFLTAVERVFNSNCPLSNSNWNCPLSNSNGIELAFNGRPHHRLSKIPYGGRAGFSLLLQKAAL